MLQWTGYDVTLSRQSNAEKNSDVASGLLTTSPFRPCCYMQPTQASAAPTYHVLQYKYVTDILEKRGPFREQHLAFAGQKVASSVLLASRLSPA